MLKVKLLFCALFAMMSFTAQADEDEFVVTSGDFNVVRQPGKIGRLEVDFTQAKVGNLSTMEMTDQTMSIRKKPKRPLWNAGTMPRRR